MVEPEVENEYDQEPALEPYINKQFPQDPDERFKMDVEEPKKKARFSLLPELHNDLKQVRWLHLGDLSLLKAIDTVKAGGIPAWARWFTGTLTVKAGTPALSVQAGATSGGEEVLFRSEAADCDKTDLLASDDKICQHAPEGRGDGVEAVGKVPNVVETVQAAQDHCQVQFQ
jgi:hypothetical protein